MGTSQALYMYVGMMRSEILDQFENHRGSQTEIVKNECWCKKTYPLVDMGMRSKIYF